MHEGTKKPLAFTRGAFFHRFFINHIDYETNIENICKNQNKIIINLKILYS